MDNFNKGLMILGNGTEFEEHDICYKVLAGGSVSRENRKMLKSMGCQLFRHRSGEYWIFEKENLRGCRQSPWDYARPDFS